MATSIFLLAQSGMLTKADVKGAPRGEIDVVKSRLTPLGIAVWMGHYDAAKILLKDGNANPDGGPDFRAPICIALSRAENKKKAAKFVSLLLSFKANASSECEIYKATPLWLCVTRDHDPFITTLLVDHGANPQAPLQANGKSAWSEADRCKNRDQLSAMRPRQDRTRSRIEAGVALSGLALLIVGWANRRSGWMATAGAVVVAAVVTSRVGAIKKRFHMSGSRKDVQPEPTDKALFASKIAQDIKDRDLDKLFPPESEFLKKLVDRAVDLAEDPSVPVPVEQLMRRALYQTVLYCDDSGSMTGGTPIRKDSQMEIVERIAAIATRIVPDNEGIELRFINHPVEPKMSKPDVADIKSIMDSVTYHGWTEIGTKLRAKVLEPLVYAPLRDGRLSRPLLVSIITDGCPSGPSDTPETYNTLKGVILECGNELRGKGYSDKVVRFHIGQIGSDEDATEFLRSLREMDELKDVLFCTAEAMDEEFARLRDNDSSLERWLFRLLVSPILDADEK